MSARVICIGVVFLALMAPVPARASCIPLTERQRLERADAVFVGRVVWVSDSGASARFRILHVRKGRLRTRSLVKVLAVPFPASTTIGWGPRRGQRWRVYAERRATRWTTDDCLGTRRA